MSPDPSPSSVGPPTRRVYSSWLKSEGVVNSNMPWFSVKNGRLSLMKVSVALEVHHQVIALHLAEVGIHGGRELRLAVWLPEHVKAGVAVAAALSTSSYSPET